MRHWVVLYIIVGEVVHLWLEVAIVGNRGAQINEGANVYHNIMANMQWQESGPFLKYMKLSSASRHNVCV